MVQKAKLDILENLPELEIVDESILSDIQEESMLPSREKWAINKLLLIGALVLIAVLVFAAFLWSYLTRTTYIIIQVRFAEKS